MEGQGREIVRGEDRWGCGNGLKEEKERIEMMRENRLQERKGCEGKERNDVGRMKEKGRGGD